MDHEIHTVADLMRAAADALNRRDTDAVESLMRISRNWLQPEGEADAQRGLLEAVYAAVHDLALAEEDAA